MIYVGADLSFGTSFSKSNEYKEIIDSAKAVNSNTYFRGKKGDYLSVNSQIKSNFNIGISPFIGVRFKLSDRFSLGTEFTVSIFSFSYSGKSVQKFSSVKNGEYSEEIRENFNPTLRYNSSLNGSADIRAIFIIGK